MQIPLTGKLTKYFYHQWHENNLAKYNLQNS